MQNTKKSLLKKVNKFMKEGERSKNVLRFSISQKAGASGVPSEA